MTLIWKVPFWAPCLFTFVGILREIRFAVLSLCGFVTLLSAKANFSLAPTIIREGFKYNGFFSPGRRGALKNMTELRDSLSPLRKIFLVEIIWRIWGVMEKNQIVFDTLPMFTHKNLISSSWQFHQNSKYCQKSCTIKETLSAVFCLMLHIVPFIYRAWI